MPAVITAMAIRRHSKKPEGERKTASERIEKLFSEAEKAFAENPGRSNSYIALARKIAMKYKVKIRTELKRRFCKHCYSFLKPGINCRVRLTEGHVTYYCLSCKKYMRFPYKPRRNSTKPEQQTR
jgi:ribonuclease P protein subunit RPR2